MEATENRTDVLIIGAGVMGLMVAAEMLHRGKSVRIIDRNFSGPTRTHIGEIALFSGDPVLENLTLQSRTAWNDAAARYGEDFGVTVRGVLELANTKGRVVVAQTEAQNGSNTACLMDNATIAEKAGTPIAPEILAAKWDADAPVLSTHTVLESLQRIIKSKGAIVWGTDEVVELLLDSSDGNNRLKGVRVKSGGVAYAEEIIVSAGAMTHMLLETLELKLPLRPVRQHLVTYHLQQPAGQVMLAHRMRRGHVLFKHLREGPLMMAYDGLMDPMQATYSLQPDEGMVELMQVYLAGMLPILKTAVHMDTQVVTGAVAPDFRPVIGRWPGVMGLWVLTGFAGRNFAYAAVVAQSLGQALGGENPSVNLAPFSPERFELDRWPRFQRPPSLAWNEQATFAGKAKFASNVNTTGTGPAEFMNNVQMTGSKGKVQMGGTGEVKVREKTKGKVQMGGVKVR